MNHFVSNNISSQLCDDKFLKTLSKEIIHRCSEFNVKISNDFAFLAIQLFSSRYICKVSKNAKIESFMEEFINECVKKLLATNNPSIKTIEMQSLFINPLSLETISEKYIKKMYLTAETLLKEILELNAKTKDDQDRCFKKIVIDIILYNKLGKPGNPKVVTETTSALKSVMSRSDLINFLNLPKHKRLETLHSLRQIVCGIRLFNKDAGHCEEGIPDIISDVTEAYENIKIVLNDTHEMLLKRITLLQEALLNTFTVDDETNEIIYALINDIDENEIEFLKDVTIMNCQHEHCVKYLIDFMNEIEKEIDSKINDYRHILKNLHEIVQFRVAIPTEKVFPHFIRISDVWHLLLNFIYVIVDINKINDKCLQIVNESDLESSYMCLAKKIIENNHDELDCAKINKYSRTNNVIMMNFKCENDCKIIKNFYNSMVPTFNKFCTYLFIIGNGILVPSQLNLGLIQYNGKNYAFSKEKYAEIFMKNIKEYSKKLLNVIENRPATIILFDLLDEIRENNKFETNIRTDDLEKCLSKVKLDQEIQTELHPIPYRKDKNYQWNIWELRRHAIKLADIKNYRTQSALTDISYFKRSFGVQAKLPGRDVQTQTKVDNSTCITKIDELKHFNI